MKYAVQHLVVFLLLLSACAKQSDSSSSTNGQAVRVNQAPAATKLGDYWYQGKAELSRYELLQNRYKDQHPGEVVMIFVTEDFLTDKQVKNDNYTNPNSVPILKNNIVKTFPTGIYTYSIMTSVFTPVNTTDQPRTLKVSNSSQEWCGQTYMQVNYDERKKTYDFMLHSYFENEADKTGRVQARWMEEEFFNRIRIAPDQLPTGRATILPSTEYSRLTHREYSPVQAELSIKEYTGADFEGKGLVNYTIDYPNLQRKVEIIFEKETPHHIIGWRDTYPSLFDKQPRTTIAKRTHTIMDAYWQHNDLADQQMRDELGLGH